MRYPKGGTAGRAARESLVDEVRHCERVRLWGDLRRARCRADGPNDAFAPLWTAHRIRETKHVVDLIDRSVG